MNGEHRVEEMRQTDPVRLGDESEQRTVAVEAPRPTGLCNLQAGFVVAIKNLVCHATVGTAVDEGQRVRAVPGHAHNRGEGVR